MVTQELESTRLCQNCNQTISGKGLRLSTGVQLCDQDCLYGWMNGERSKYYLELVAKLKKLLIGS
jgi:hypothetical protein